MIVALLFGLFIIVVGSITIYKKSDEYQRTQVPTPTTVNKTVPDAPIGFGYKCMWLAVKTGDKTRLAAMLQLRNVSDCNWQVGIARAYEGAVFVTPPLDGWTLACGWGLPHGDSKEGIDEVKTLLETLSRTFGDAQFFCTHRVTEYHCWMKATGGHIDRVYSYLGETGENIAVEGQPTEFEQTLHLANTLSDEAKDEHYFDREDVVWPDEELVMQVAGHWSVDPSKLDARTDIALGLGLLGERK